jgi:hypothetical protein
MVTVLQWVLWLIGLGLQGLLILTLFHGAWREFPALFAYIAALVATTTGEIIASTVLGKRSAYFLSYYWSAELLRQTALFALVVSLVVHAFPSDRKSESYSRLMTAPAVLLWLLSITLHYSSDVNDWMTAAVRNISFLTGVLNLLAWFCYVKAGARDTTRLMIAGGLGLQMTGEAIGQAIRQMNPKSYEVMFAGAMIIVITHLLCLFIWWRALSTTRTYSERRPV